MEQNIGQSNPKPKTPKGKARDKLNFNTRTTEVDSPMHTERGRADF